MIPPCTDDSEVIGPGLKQIVDLERAGRPIRGVRPKGKPANTDVSVSEVPGNPDAGRRGIWVGEIERVVYRKDVIFVVDPGQELELVCDIRVAGPARFLGFVPGNATLVDEDGLTFAADEWRGVIDGEFRRPDLVGVPIGLSTAASMCSPKRGVKCELCICR